MTALAEVLSSRGACVSGSDVEDSFYTDEILASIGIRPKSPFKAENLPPGTEIVIRSAAYSIDSNPELIAARERGLPIMIYPEALGELSATCDASGIAGVHGKTTTSALCASLARSAGIPATVIAGSGMADMGGRSTYTGGDSFLIAETCEYRRHFLNFKPRRVVLTSVESDHQDYYPTYADILAAFVEYASSLPKDGCLIYCADQEGACEVERALRSSRPELRRVPYGHRAHGPYRLHDLRMKPGAIEFGIEKYDRPFVIKVPGAHNALNAVGAIALMSEIGEASGLEPKALEDGFRRALEDFKGTKRRSEVIGEAGGVLFLDDYAHHPTAIRSTIEGIRFFYPGRRLVLDFMPHTASRTSALLGDFAASFDRVDALVLHGVYASARDDKGSLNVGKKLKDAIEARGIKLLYTEGPLEALPALEESLKEGDIFMTMGAGDNFRLSWALFERARLKKGHSHA
jgi:UDP-N-acetylmuramate--alanine ligase